MVSAQVAGNLRIYIQAPSGTRKLVKSAPTYWFGPGGSSIDVIANTPEKWNFLPPSVDTGGPGYSILVTFISGAAKTLDISDASWILPVIVNGNLQNVGNPDSSNGLGNDNFVKDFLIGDVALVASTETIIAQLRAKEGVHFKVGGDKVFMSIEDNA